MPGFSYCGREDHRFSPWRENSQTGKARRTCMSCAIAQIRQVDGTVKTTFPAGARLAVK